MLLAVSAMDPVVQFCFFLVAVILFILASFNVSSPRLGLLAAGLACFAIPFMWNALAAA
jgi:hypothetical protein